jgi:TP901 family phage tail tape measure protein
MGTIGDLFVNIHANARGLVSGLAYSQKKLNRFRRSAERTGKQLQGLSRRMAMFGASAAVPILASVKAFASFEKSMSNVATMLDEPERHMRRFTGAVSRMSVEFGESTDALAGGLYDILSASIAPDKALKTLEVSVRAAKAGMTDTKTAADAITTVLNSYGLAASDAASVSDLLFSIVKRGKTTFAELAPAIGNTASLAASAGVSQEELAATLAVLTRNGVKTDVAITAVNAVISAFAKTTDNAEAAAKKLELNMSAATLQSKGLLGAMRKLEGVNLDELAEIFPNIRALKGVIKVAGDVGGFADDVEAMNNRLGATNRAFKIATDNMAMQFDKAKQAIVSLGRAIGEAISGESGDLLKQIQRIAQQLERWVRQNGEVIRSIVTLLPKLALAAVGVYALGTAFKAAGVAATIFAATGPFIGGLIAVTAVTTGLTMKVVSLAEEIRNVGGNLKELQGKADRTASSLGSKLQRPDLSKQDEIQATRKAMHAQMSLLIKQQHRYERAIKSGYAHAPAGTREKQESIIESTESQIRKYQKRLRELQRQIDAGRAAARKQSKQSPSFNPLTDLLQTHFGQNVPQMGPPADDTMKKGATAWRDYRRVLQGQADAVVRFVQTPGEMFDEQMKKLRELRAEGVLTEEFFLRASKKYKTQLDATQTAKQQQPGSIGTAVGQFKFTPQASTQKAMLQQAQQQTQNTQVIAQQTTNMNRNIRLLGPQP